MDFLVDGEKQEITVIDPKTGLEWTKDWMSAGEHENSKYDQEQGIYVIDKKEFDWWKEREIEYDRWIDYCEEHGIEPAEFEAVHSSSYNLYDMETYYTGMLHEAEARELNKNVRINDYRRIVNDIHEKFGMYNEEYSQKEHQDALVYIRNGLAEDASKDTGLLLNDFLFSNDEFHPATGTYMSTDFLNALAQNKEMQTYLRERIEAQIIKELPFKIIPEIKAHEIIDTYNKRDETSVEYTNLHSGLYLYKQYGSHTYLALDNTDGNAWLESYDSLERAALFLSTEHTPDECHEWTDSRIYEVLSEKLGHGQLAILDTEFLKAEKQFTKYQFTEFTRFLDSYPDEHISEEQAGILFDAYLPLEANNTYRGFSPDGKKLLTGGTRGTDTGSCNFSEFLDICSRHYKSQRRAMKEVNSSITEERDSSDDGIIAEQIAKNGFPYDESDFTKTDQILNTVNSLIQQEFSRFINSYPELPVSESRRKVLFDAFLYLKDMSLIGDFSPDGKKLTIPAGSRLGRENETVNCNFSEFLKVCSEYYNSLREEMDQFNDSVAREKVSDPYDEHGDPYDEEEYGEVDTILETIDPLIVEDWKRVRSFSSIVIPLTRFIDADDMHSETPEEKKFLFDTVKLFTEESIAVSFNQSCSTLFLYPPEDLEKIIHTQECFSLQNVFKAAAAYYKYSMEINEKAARTIKDSDNTYEKQAEFNRIKYAEAERIITCRDNYCKTNRSFDSSDEDYDSEGPKENFILGIVPDGNNSGKYTVAIVSSGVCKRPVTEFPPIHIVSAVSTYANGEPSFNINNAEPDCIKTLSKLVSESGTGDALELFRKCEHGLESGATIPSAFFDSSLYKDNVYIKPFYYGMDGTYKLDKNDSSGVFAGIAYVSIHDVPYSWHSTGSHMLDVMENAFTCEANIAHGNFWQIQCSMYDTRTGSWRKWDSISGVYEKQKNIRDFMDDFRALELDISRPEKYDRMTTKTIIEAFSALQNNRSDRETNGMIRDHSVLKTCMDVYLRNLGCTDPTSTRRVLASFSDDEKKTERSRKEISPRGR